MVLGSILLVMGALYFASKVLIPLALAVLLTFILTPPAAWLQRQHVPRPAAVLLVMLMAGAVLGGIGWTITYEVGELADRLPEHSKIIAAKISSLQGGRHGFVSKFQHMAEDITRRVKEANIASSNAEPEKAVPVVVQNQRSDSLGLVPTVATHTIEVVADIVLVVMLTVFMLLRREDLRYRLIQMVGHGRLTVTTRAIDEAGQRISSFLLMQLSVNTVLGTLLALGLYLIGVPYGFLWGFLTALLRFIPYIGTWVSLLFPLALSLADPGWLKPLEVIGVFLTLELLTANILEPLLFSHTTGTSPLALLFAAAFWLWIWGPIGLVLSTPLTVCLLVLGRYVPGLAFFDVMLGSGQVLDADMRYYQRLLARDEDEAIEIVEEHLRAEPVERLYDDVLLLALARMKRDRERGDLRPGDEELIYRVTGEIVEEQAEAPESEKGDATTARARVVVLGCPARDEADELALRMLQNLFAPTGCKMEIVSIKKLSAEVIAQVRQQRPAVVCVASVPPGGTAQARYLCKRLRAQAPEAKIIVGRWGQKEEVDDTRQRLRAAGADFVGTTLRETRDLILPLVQVAAASFPNAGKPAIAEAISGNSLETTNRR